MISYDRISHRKLLRGLLLKSHGSLIAEKEQRRSAKCSMEAFSLYWTFSRRVRLNNSLTGWSDYLWYISITRVRFKSNYKVQREGCSKSLSSSLSSRSVIPVTGGFKFLGNAGRYFQKVLLMKLPVQPI